MKMNKGLFRTAVLATGVWLAVFQFVGFSQGAVTEDSAVAAKSAPAPFNYTGLPKVIVVSGTNYEMGMQYGEQAAAAINHNIAIFKSRLNKAFGSANVEKDMKVWDYYIRKFDPTLVEWIEGILAGCKKKGVDAGYLDLLAVTVYPAEMWQRPKIPYPKETHVQAAEKRLLLGANIDNYEYHSCNAFTATGAATSDGKPVVALSKMVPMEAMHSLILVAFPKGGPSFVTNPYAGGMAQNSGMNSNSFAWTMTAINQKEPIWGLQSEAIFHYLTEIAKSPAEAQEYLKSVPRAGVTGSFTLGDAAGNISVFESNSEHFVIRKPGDEGEASKFMVITNHLVDPTNRAYNPPGRGVPGPDGSLGNTFYRYATLWEFVSPAAAGSKIDFNFARNLFRSDDWYDPIAKVWHYNDPGSPNGLNNFGYGGTTTTSIFFPADLTAYFGTGTPSGIGLPAYATGEYVKIQLADNPEAVTAKAAGTAFAFYKDARDLFQKEMNRRAPYLTTLLAFAIKEKLDEAFAAHEFGMDRQAYAFLENDPAAKLALYGNALTHYATAQLYSQMAKTVLLRAGAQGAR
jgi:hypothetical protein